jgi:hypothetical protein
MAKGKVMSAKDMVLAEMARLGLDGYKVEIEEENGRCRFAFAGDEVWWWKWVNIDSCLAWLRRRKAPFKTAQGFYNGFNASGFYGVPDTDTEQYVQSRRGKTGKHLVWGLENNFGEEIYWGETFEQARKRIYGR